MSRYSYDATTKELTPISGLPVMDTTPTTGSDKAVTSDGIKAALDAKQNTLTFDTTPKSGSTNPVTSGGLYSAFSGKSDTSHTHDDRYYTESEMDTKITTLQTNFQAGVDSIYDAVVAKGTTPASKSLSDVVTGIGNIQTGSGNAIAADVLSGKTFTNSSGSQTGSMTNRGAVSQTLNTSTTSYTIPEGYHNGSGKVSITTQTKSVTPSSSAQTVTPDSGKLLSSVSVGAIQTEEKSATAYGTDTTVTVTPTSGKYLSKVNVDCSKLYRFQENPMGFSVTTKIPNNKIIYLIYSAKLASGSSGKIYLKVSSVSSTSSASITSKTSYQKGMIDLLVPSGGNNIKVTVSADSNVSAMFTLLY